MKSLFLLGAVNLLTLGALATPSPAQTADQSVQPTCRTVLGAGEFSKIQRGAGLPCCYVASERPWYDQMGVVISGIYLRPDGERFVAWRCDELSRNVPLSMAETAGGQLGAVGGNVNAGSPGSRPLPPSAVGAPPVEGGGVLAENETGDNPGTSSPDQGGDDQGNGPGDHPNNGHSGPDGDKPHEDNGKGNGVDPAPGNSGDRFGDDADGANTEGTLDTSADKGSKGKH